MKPDITKEELVELIGMADLLEAKLKDLEFDIYANSVSYISSVLRGKLDKICGEEYIQSLREPANETDE